MNTSRLSQIALAVAAAIATAPSFALDIATTNAAPYKLVVSGASAARDAFLSFLNAEACVSGTLTVFRATPTSGNDFRVYSCTLVSSTGAGDVGAALGTLAGQNVAISYRAEGGSAWGPVSLAAKALDAGFPGVIHLDTTQDTLFGAVANANYPVGPAGSNVAIPTSSAAVTGYSLASDTFTSGPLVKKQTELAIADTEPKMFTLNNYPTSTAFPQPEPIAMLGTLKGLTASRGFGQVFGIIVNTTGASTSGLLDLPASAITRIFSSNIAPNWSLFGQPSGTMPRAKRENGSGTQVSAAAFFTNYLVGDGYGFITGAFQADGSAFTGTREFGASGALATAVSVSPNAIGISVLGAPVNGTRFLAIDGVDATAANAAANKYKFFYELTLTKATGLSAEADALATTFQSILQQQKYLPDFPSIVAIPGIGGNVAGATLAGHPPVAVGSRGGNSAAPTRLP